MKNISNNEEVELRIEPGKFCFPLLLLFLPHYELLIFIFHCRLSNQAAAQ
jgi:hypothetical protein